MVRHLAFCIDLPKGHHHGDEKEVGHIEVSGDGKKKGFTLQCVCVHVCLHIFCFLPLGNLF